jgi:glycosyltransferase involved in cell wall biosynthesis
VKIHGICIAKDEADIIEQTLKAAIQWCDFIYVLDNGSTDGTWEKVLTLSKDYEQIIPYKQDNRTYHNTMRSEVYHHYLSNSAEGDWWCRLDSDEIYIDDPRIFLAKVPQQYQAVWCASFQYYFTDKDLELFNRSPSRYADEIPVEQKCRYYINNWSEARFFKYDKQMTWDKRANWPYFGAIYPVRIWLKHYQYRSPQQIQKRINIRREAATNIKDNSNFIFLHELQAHWKVDGLNSSQPSMSTLNLQPGKDWKARIVEAAQLNYDAGDRRYVVREDLMPKLPSGNPFLVNKMRMLKKFR